MTRKKFCFISLIISWICLMVSVGETWGADIEFIFFQRNAAFKDNKEAATALRALEKWLSNELKTTVKGNFFQKELDTNNFITSAKPAFALVDLQYYVTHNRKMNLVPILIPVRDNKSSGPAILVVRRDSGFDSIFSVQGKTLATPGQGAILNNYLSNVIFEQQIDVAQFFTLRQVDTANSAVLAVLYKEADVAVVDKAFFDSDFPEKENFKVLMTSREILYHPLCLFRGNTSNAIAEKIKNAFLNLHQGAVAKDFNALLRIDRWQAIDRKAYQPLERLLTTTTSTFSKDFILADTSAAVQNVEASSYRISPEPIQVFALSEDTD